MDYQYNQRGYLQFGGKSLKMKRNTFDTLENQIYHCFIYEKSTEYGSVHDD